LLQRFEPVERSIAAAHRRLATDATPQAGSAVGPRWRWREQRGCPLASAQSPAAPIGGFGRV